MLCSAVYLQMIQNNTGKPFSIDIYNRKILEKVIAVLKQFSYCFVNRGCTYLNLGTLIKGLYKLVSVANRKLLVTYENSYRGRHMFLYQICLCFYLISIVPLTIFFKNSPCFPKYSVTISQKSLDTIGKLELIRKMLYASCKS